MKFTAVAFITGITTAVLARKYSSSIAADGPERCTA